MIHRVRRGLVAVVLTGLAVAGCSAPNVGLSQSAPRRPMVVGTSERVTTTDPAVATDTGSTTFVYNVYQRLLSAAPNTGLLRPDAAAECMFLDSKTYSCSLRRNIYFANGKRLSGADVKNSIERALRMNVPGTSIELLGSLAKIELVDEFRVDFKLKHEDTQFGFALASPAASIVDTDQYTDQPWPLDKAPIGSGPYEVAAEWPKATATTSASPTPSPSPTPAKAEQTAPPVPEFGPNEWHFLRNWRYSGSGGPVIPDVWIRSYPDYAALERDMLARRVDAMWHGAPAGVLHRLLEESNEGDKRTDAGFSRTPASGARVQRLEWNPRSPQRNRSELRRQVVAATGTIRTMDSILPASIPGHVASYPVGAQQVTPLPAPAGLTLGYDAWLPDQRDLADKVAKALEPAGIKVTLRPDDLNADLQLVERRPWTDTPDAWMQAWLENPVPESRDKLPSMDLAFRNTTELGRSRDALGDLQRQAAEDATVVPLTQEDDYLWTAEPVDVGSDKVQKETGRYFASGNRLALWGLRW